VSDSDELERVDARIKELTGESYHLYTSIPGDHRIRVVFKDGVKFGYAAGLNHARRFLMLLERPVACGNTFMHGMHEWSRDGGAVACLGVR